MGYQNIRQKIQKFAGGVKKVFGEAIAPLVEKATKKNPEEMLWGKASNDWALDSESKQITQYVNGDLPKDKIKEMTLGTGENLDMAKPKVNKGKLATGISKAEALANPKKYTVVNRKDNYLDLRGLNLNAKTFLNNVMFDNSNKMVRAWRDKRFFKLDNAGNPIKDSNNKQILEQIGYDLGIIDNIRDPNILGTDIVVRNPERFQLARKTGGQINYNK